jgi:predicted transcriptional regulator
MKQVTIAVLNNRDLIYAGLLEESGLGRSAARALVCLMIRGHITVREMAVATQMTSASVNVALRKLRERGMVLSEDSATGRNADRRYSPAGDWKCILGLIEDHERSQVAMYREKASKVRKDIKNKYGYALDRPR